MGFLPYGFDDTPRSGGHAGARLVEEAVQLGAVSPNEEACLDAGLGAPVQEIELSVPRAGQAKLHEAADPTVNSSKAYPSPLLGVLIYKRGFFVGGPERHGLSLAFTE